MIETLSTVQIPEFTLQFGVQIILAAVLGGLIGLERELSDKPAGLRTNILICVGATLVTVISTHFTTEIAEIITDADQARIASQIVSGIGFLGAGTIIQSRGNVHGLTTAATLWVVAAIGMAVGLGINFWAILTTAFVLMVLVPLNYVEKNLMHQSSYWLSLQMEDDLQLLETVENILADVGLRTKRIRLERDFNGGSLIVNYDTTGPKYLFDEAQEEVIKNSRVKNFEIHKY